MKKVFLSLGSNVQPEIYIPQAIEQLKKVFSILAVSPVYETDPVGPAGNQKFWNLCAAAVWEEPSLMISKIRQLEASLGRVRGLNKFAPRTIDIDILPQEGYQKLAFIMIPLADIAPNESDPESGKTFKELANLLEGERKNFRVVIK